MEAIKKEDYAKVSLKYIIEGAVIALVAYLVPIYMKNSLRKPKMFEIIAIAVTAAFTMFILDMFSTETARGARIGAGFGVAGKISGYDVLGQQRKFK